jgi:hypothetical protein
MQLKPAGACRSYGGVYSRLRYQDIYGLRLLIAAANGRDAMMAGPVGISCVQFGSVCFEWQERGAICKRERLCTGKSPVYRRESRPVIRFSDIDEFMFLANWVQATFKVCATKLNKLVGVGFM